jgi:hypothetical protein
MDRYPHKSKDLAFRVLGDEAMVANFPNSCLYNLNPVGTFIWERVDGKSSLGQIAAHLANEYNIDFAVACRDCQQFIDELVEEGLLQWEEKPSMPEEFSPGKF